MKIRLKTQDVYSSETKEYDDLNKFLDHYPWFACFYAGGREKDEIVTTIKMIVEVHGAVMDTFIRIEYDPEG